MEWKTTVKPRELDCEIIEKKDFIIFMEENKDIIGAEANYGDGNIVTLEGLEHVRRRPGMYIGKLGDGTHSDDGIYVLLKEVIDNSIDEYRMGFGKIIEIKIIGSDVKKSIFF